jgi:hypothetical protein
VCARCLCGLDELEGGEDLGLGGVVLFGDGAAQLILRLLRLGAELQPALLALAREPQISLSGPGVGYGSENLVVPGRVGLFSEVGHVRIEHVGADIAFPS